MEVEREEFTHLQTLVSRALQNMEEKKHWETTAQSIYLFIYYFGGETNGLENGEVGVGRVYDVDT